MYYLNLLKQIGYMERKQNSTTMIVSVSDMIPINTIIPIVLNGIQISEAKVIDNNLFESKIKVILKNDKSLIPQFECRHEQVIYQNMKNALQDFEDFENENKPNDKVFIFDARPVTFPLMKIFVPDLLDFEGLTNLELNVRFKGGIYQYGPE